MRVINVDVVVTDRKGNRVTGLTKDDFEIYQNGIPKPISNFYEVITEKKPAPAPAVAGAPPPRPAPVADIPENQRRRIIFYIDNLSLAPFNRNRVFKEMKKRAFYEKPSVRRKRKRSEAQRRRRKEQRRRRASAM